MCVIYLLATAPPEFSDLDPASLDTKHYPSPHGRPVNTWDMVMATAALDCHVQTHNHVFMKSPRFAEPMLHKNNTNHAAVDPKQLIGNALHQRVEAIDHELCDAGDEDTFYVADLGDVYRQHLRWKKNLPRIKPFYGGFYPTTLSRLYVNIC